jgi:carboxyl-terminal processing protease
MPLLTGVYGMMSRYFAWGTVSFIAAISMLLLQHSSTVITSVHAENFAVIQPAPKATEEKTVEDKTADEKSQEEKTQEDKADKNSETNTVKDKDVDDYELMQMFVETFKQIDANYVKDISRKELVEAAIRGMITELDPYSSYIDEEEKASFEQDVTQEFGGIGIQVNFDPSTKTIQVISPLPGTPAYKAGIKAGDRIVEIEGQEVKDFKPGSETNTAVRLMKGPAGGIVKLGIQREGSTDTIKFEVERAVIKVATVMGDTYAKDGKWNYMLDETNKIGYIRLTHFTANTTSELKRAMGDLVEQGMKGLILDLRFNPGGLLTAATEICDMFIESGKIVSTKGRNTPERTWEARKRGTYGNFPMAILVNHYSASASEIVSACLQDHKRALIIGERTWGKGSVQNVIDVNGGASSLKLTTASYHRPSGKNIHRFPGATDKDEWGVMPDDGFKIEYNNRQLSDYLLYRQKRDILNEKGPDSENKFDDSQLSKAKEIILKKINESPVVKQNEDKTENDKDNNS